MATLTTGLATTDTRLHVLELIDATLRVALTDLAQRLVFVTTLTHVLTMDLVVDRLHGRIGRLGQVLFQGLGDSKTRC